MTNAYLNSRCPARILYLIGFCLPGFPISPLPFHGEKGFSSLSDSRNIQSPQLKGGCIHLLGDLPQLMLL